MNRLNEMRTRTCTSEIVLGTIKSRRSVRTFSKRHVPSAYQRQLIETARWAPTGSNIQPWSFILIEDPQVIRLIRMFAQGLSGNPTLIIALCCDKPDLRYQLGPRSVTCFTMDVAMAAENILIMAAVLGLGACAHFSFSENALKVILEIQVG